MAIDKALDFPPDVGYVYALVNRAWPGVVKLGMAGSIKRRWFSYQTGDPYRQYRMLGWSDVLLDTRLIERELHTLFEAQRVDGSREWFRITEAQARAALNKYRREPLTGTPVGPEEIPADWYDDGDIEYVSSSDMY